LPSVILYIRKLPLFFYSEILPGVVMLGDVWVEVDKDEVEMVREPAHREEHNNQGKHPDDLHIIQTDS